MTDTFEIHNQNSRVLCGFKNLLLISFSFYIKNKLKPEIFNNKKSLQRKNVFACHD